MTFELPDDLQRWPRDPYQLLGLDRAADERTAKRAYFKLIKKFKPDKFPAEFQLIREAYDQVQLQLSWKTDRDNGQQSPARQREKEMDSRAESTDDFRPQRSLSTTALANDPFEKFQQQLAAGDVKRAVAIINQIDSSANRSVVARASMTKYFLSLFFPSASESNQHNPNLLRSQAQNRASDGELKRITRLLSALSDSRFQFLMLERLSAELETNPRLATCEPVNQFLQRCEDVEALEAVVRLRWQAIGLLDWRVVVEDFNSLKPRSLELGSRWERLITESLEYTVWHHHAGCGKHNHDCWEEISQSTNTWAADTVELLILAAEQWQSIRPKCRWQAVFPWLRNSAPKTLRNWLLPVAIEINADRDGSLDELNILSREASLAMEIFVQGLQRLASLEADDEWLDDEFGSDEQDWTGLREQVACFFYDTHFYDYRVGRRSVLEFCINNQLHPFDFAQAADTFLGEQESIGWASLIRNDGPLLSVYYASQIAESANGS